MPKRGNELSQLRAEEYDAVVNRSSSDAPTGRFSRASADVLRKRKIVSRTGKFQKAARSAAPKPSVSATGAAVGSSPEPAAVSSSKRDNPFGNFSFGAPSPAPTQSVSSTSSPSSKRDNPFGNFSFGAPPPTSAASSASASSAVTQSAANTDKHIAPSSLNVDKENRKIDDALTSQLMELHRHPRWDMRLFLTQVISTHAHLKRVSEKIANAPVSSATKTRASAPASSSEASTKATPSLFAPGPGSSTLTNDNATATPSKPLFGSSSGSSGLFGTPAASTDTAKKPFSFNTATSTDPPAGSAKTSNSNFAFSLSKPATASPSTAAPADGAAGSTDNVDGSGNGENEELASADHDWDTTVQCRVKIFRKDEEFKALCGGTVKLQQHKTDSSKRMVMRDIAGKVVFNMGVNSNMTFSKSLTGKNKQFGQVTFKGLMAGSKEPQLFVFKCRAADLDALYGKLAEYSS